MGNLSSKSKNRALSTPAAATAAAQPEVNGVEEAAEKRRHTTLAVSSKKVAEEEALGEAEAIVEPPGESPAQTTEEAPAEVVEAPAEAPTEVPVGAPLEAPAAEMPADVDPAAGEGALTAEAPADEPAAADSGVALAEVDGTAAPASMEETKEPLKVTIRKNFSAAKRRLSLRFRKSEAPAGSTEEAATGSTEGAATGGTEAAETEVAEPTAAESPDPTAADAPLTADATVAVTKELASEVAEEQTTGASVEAAAVAEPVDAAALEEAPTHPPPPIPESPSNEEGVEIALPVASTEEVAATSVVLDETAAPREEEVAIESAEAAADVEISTSRKELESVEGKLQDTMIDDQPVEDAMIVDEPVDEHIEDPEASEKKKALPPALAIKIDLRKSFKSAKKSISKSMGKKQGAKPEVDAEVGDASDAEGASRKSVDIGTPVDGASSVEQSSAEDAEDTDDALDVGEKSASVPGTPSKKKINVRKSLRKVKKNLSKSFRKSKAPASAAEEETAAGEEPAVPSLPGEADARVSGEVSMEASTEEILVEPVVEGQTEEAGKGVEASNQEIDLLEEEAALDEQQVAVGAPATKKKNKHYSAKMPQFGQCFGKDRASSDTEGDADSANVMVVDNSPEAHLDLTHQSADETKIDRSIEDVTTIEEVEIVGSAVLYDASSDEHAALPSHEEISVALDMKEREATSTPELLVSDCTPVIIIDASAARDLDKTSVTTPLDETLPELKLDQDIRKSELENEGETPLYDHVTVLRKKDVSTKSRESLVLYYESSTITHEESEALVIEHSTAEPDMSPAINKPDEIQSFEEHLQIQEVEEADETKATAQLVPAYADPEETADAKVIDEPTQVGLVVTTVLVPTAVVVDVGETKAEMSKPDEQNAVVDEETVKAEDKPLGDCNSKEAVIASEIIAILEPAEVSRADAVVADPDQIVEEDIKDEVEEAELSCPRETEITVVAETAVESATAVCSDEILISAQKEVIVAKEDEEPENTPKTRVAEEPARAVSIDEAVLTDPVETKKREEITEAPTSLHLEVSIETDHSDAEGCVKETEMIAETAAAVELDSEIIKGEDCKVENPDDQKTVRDDVKDTASDDAIIEESKLEVLIIGPSKGINAAESKTDIIKTTSVTSEVNGHVESTITLEKHEDLVTVNDLPHESIMDADTIYQSKTMIFLENRL